MQVPRYVGLLHGQDLLDAAAALPRRRGQPEGQVRRRVAGHGLQRREQQERERRARSREGQEQEGEQQYRRGEQHTQQEGEQDKEAQVGASFEYF